MIDSLLRLFDDNREFHDGDWYVTLYDGRPQPEPPSLSTIDRQGSTPICRLVDMQYVRVCDNDTVHGRFMTLAADGKDARIMVWSTTRLKIYSSIMRQQANTVNEIGLDHSPWITKSNTDYMYPAMIEWNGIDAQWITSNLIATITTSSSWQLPVQTRQGSCTIAIMHIGDELIDSFNNGIPTPSESKHNGRRVDRWITHQLIMESPVASNMFSITASSRLMHQTFGASSLPSSRAGCGYLTRRFGHHSDDIYNTNSLHYNNNDIDCDSACYNNRLLPSRQQMVHITEHIACSFVDAYSSRSPSGQAFPIALISLIITYLL